MSRKRDGCAYAHGGLQLHRIGRPVSGLFLLETPMTEVKPSKEASPKRLLVNAKQAAEILSIGPTKLWSLTASREIPSVRIGRAVRYLYSDLETFVSDRRASQFSS